jgi:hypothetical protein
MPTAMITMRSSALDSLTIVREKLLWYADRGVFRGFSEYKTKAGLPAFRFLWLSSRPMELTVNTARNMLEFRRVLPGVPGRSPLYARLKSFIAERHDQDLPEHRRVDPARAEAGCSNRSQHVSVSLAVKDNQYEYATGRLVNLVHELFVYLRDTCPEYLMENLDAPQE